jgi:hypothetical protein
MSPGCRETRRLMQRFAHGDAGAATLFPSADGEGSSRIIVRLFC